MVVWGRWQLCPASVVGWPLILSNWGTVRHKQVNASGWTDFCGRVVAGFMNCIILARLTFSNAVSSGSIAEAFLLSEGGAVGTETLRILFTARVKCGSGSRHRGGAVDICTRLDNRPDAVRSTHQNSCLDLQSLLVRPNTPRLLIHATDVSVQRLPVRL